MKKAIVSVLVLVFIMNGFCLYGAVKADVSRVPGVKAGDWAKYSVLFNFSSNDPQPPIYINPPLNDLDYYMIEIVSVASSNVTYQIKARYLNGTEFTTVDWIDVSTGQMAYGTSTFGPVIGANLTAGDKTYLNGYSPTLNYSETRVFAGTTRQVNRLVTYQSFSFQNETNSAYYDFVWDRLSGLIVLIDENVTLTRNGYLTQMQIRLTIKETNIWAPSPPTVAAEVFFIPRVLNLKSRGDWVIAIIEMPEKASVRDVDLSSIKINGTIPATGRAILIGRRLILIRFNRQELIKFVKEHASAHTGFCMRITLVITADLRNGSRLQGSDTVFIIRPPTKSHFLLQPD